MVRGQEASSITKREHERILEGDGAALYPGCGDGYMNLYIYILKLKSVHTHPVQKSIFTVCKFKK